MSAEKPVFLVTKPIMRTDINGDPIQIGVEGEVYDTLGSEGDIEELEKREGVKVSVLNLVRIQGTRSYK